jgi:hypothetical protein
MDCNRPRYHVRGHHLQISTDKHSTVPSAYNAAPHNSDKVTTEWRQTPLCQMGFSGGASQWLAQ